MNRKLVKILPLVLVLCIMCGCAKDDQHENMPSAVDDIFSHSETTSQTEPAPENVTVSDGNQGADQDLGSLSHGFSNTETDDNGRYVNYQGGELEITYKLKGTGQIAENGIGLLLFLDGQPQTYRVANGEEYSYLHTLYPDAEKAEITLYLTPTAGKQGDTLELYAFAILDPDFYPTKGEAIGHKHTFGALFTNTLRVNFEADAPSAAMLDCPKVYQSCEITVVDLGSVDTSGKTQEDLNNNIYAAVNIAYEPMDYTYLYEVTSDSEIRVELEVYGCTEAEYGVVFFIDNQPISTDPAEYIYVQPKLGKKCTAAITMQIPDFDGSAVLYGVLIPRNRAEIMHYADCEPISFDTLYLTSEAG